MYLRPARLPRATWIRSQILMHLCHLHIPYQVSYLHTARLQTHLVSLHLCHKALVSRLGTAVPPAPHPTLLTFQTFPTYTCGRREIGKLSSSQIAHLRCNGEAEFYEAQRGGQTTFHGPGQLTAYLITALDKHGLSPTTYIQMLEASVIDTCTQYGLASFTTENPGVWTSEDNKIASVGVHLRRNVTSHGVGLNVSTDLKWFDRIVACGLVGKRATNLEEKGIRAFSSSLSEVAKVFAMCVRTRLKGVIEVKEISEKEIMMYGSDLKDLESV